MITFNWSTSSEINNIGFEPERMILRSDQNGNTVWEKTVFVEGKGTTTGTSNYNFSDKVPAAGIYNYILE
jgi:hypothetical protein